MADTIFERIMQNVVTTLQGITTGAGYSVTVQQVYRNTSAPQADVLFPYVFIPEPQQDAQDQPLGLTTKFAHLELWAWVNTSFSTPHVTLNNLCGDIEKALRVDVTRGGLAVDTDVRSPRVSADETPEPFQHAAMAVDIHYRHKYGDPYSLT